MLLFFSQLSSVLESNLSWYPQWHDQVTRIFGQQLKQLHWGDSRDTSKTTIHA